MKDMLIKIDECVWKLKMKVYVKMFGVPPRPMIRQLNGNNLTGVEIGVYRGEHAISILKNCDVKMLYLIDPFLNYETYTDDYGKETSLDDVFKTTTRRMKNHTDKIQFIRDFSSSACGNVPNNLDFVYVDGNHGYEFVKQDIEMYWKKIRLGGIIGGHDVSNGGCMEHNGIITAVSEFAVENGVQIYIQSPDWWIVKSHDTRLKSDGEHDG